MHSTYTQVRDSLAKLLDQVTHNREIVILQRRGEEEVAILAASKQKNLLETAYLLRSLANAKRLLTALGRAFVDKTPSARMRRQCLIWVSCLMIGTMLLSACTGEPVSTIISDPSASPPGQTEGVNTESLPAANSPNPVIEQLPEPTATADPLAQYEYTDKFELSQDFLGGGVWALTDANGQLVTLVQNGTEIAPNQAGYYVDAEGQIWAWNSQEGKPVQAYSINGGNLKVWDGDAGRYKSVRDKDNLEIKAEALKGLEQGLAVVDKDGEMIFLIDAEGQKLTSSQEGLWTINGQTFYWQTETQLLREIRFSTANPNEVSSELGLTHEDYQQFIITLGRNNNDGEWYNYVTLAGEDPEDQGARLARLNPDGTWSQLTYDTQEGKEEMFGHLVPLGENPIVSYGDFDFYNNHGDTGMEILDLKGYNTGLRASYTLDNLDRYTSETVEVVGPLVAMRDRMGRVVLGLSAFTSPQLRALYQNDFLRVSDEPKRGGYYVVGAAEDLWRLITPGITVFTRMYSRLPERLGYYDHIFTAADGKEVGSQYHWMIYQTYRRYQEQVERLVALLENGGQTTEEAPWFIMPKGDELVIAPDK